ncbi:MAG: hypothetical protein WD757_03935 [Actinomycetota bacterium]
MGLLRRILYLEAAIWVVAGVALAAVPESLMNLLDQAAYPEHAWLRVAGIQAITLAMLMVLVAQKIDDHWWWSWAFVFGTGALATFFLFKAAFGIGSGASSGAPSWAIGTVSALLTAALLAGLGRAGRENPMT